MTLTSRHPSIGRSLPWGVAIVLLYLLATPVPGHRGIVPGRLLLDGIAPLQPYRWQHPPPELARDNQLPSAGAAVLPLGPMGSRAASVATDDGQATISLNDNAIAPASGSSALRVTITPVDAGKLAPPPANLRFDSNAYQMEAVYPSTGRPAQLRRPVTIVLRYATGATEMLHYVGAAWTAIKSTRYPGPLQVLVADSETLGTFTAAAPRDFPYVHRTSWWVYALAAGVPLAALLIWLLPRMLARRRRALLDSSALHRKVSVIRKRRGGRRRLR